MDISKTADYALRATLQLASVGTLTMTAEQLASAQRIPHKFLQGILFDLKRADLVVTQRGAGGGYRLARPADSITLADIVRAVEGPLVKVQGRRPETVEYEDVAQPLREVWIAVRVSLRNVLESVTVADVISGKLPGTVQELIDQPDAWVRH